MNSSTSPKKITFLFMIALVVAVSAWTQAPFRASSKPFPLQGILPKAETGALRFLKEHPEFDGRGVVVAIFDTGVDPGAPGLQMTSDGRPKIVDLVDGSGSGDVDTSTVLEIKDDVLEGLSGRMLKPGQEWKNPTGKYHIGIKVGFELFPTSLVSRLKKERKKEWDKTQRERMTALQRRLAEFDENHPKPEGGKKKERGDIEARISQLETLQKTYNDPGPIYDCVVFHDGKAWHAAIDTDENGDLGDEKLMTHFRSEQQHASFGEQAMMNFALNIYNNGNLLSIVTDVGAHGTHVAGIVAANYPEKPELNGLAPGAQIVSVKIGDRRMGSSSMGTGEVRGLITVLENKCDLINMSYGGPTQDPNDGRLAGLYSEIVNKHNVIFVASAGNSGPALSTVGAPGGTTSAIFGIGAYVSPSMMEAQYSLRETLPANQYTWSSRGPVFDGDLGVNFSAPGGAIAPVSNWTLQGNMMMNGTSMSSPSACGGIALLLSGMKKEGIPITPYRVRRAIENTARSLPNVEPFAQGRGVVQIDKTFDYLVQFQEFSDQDLRFEVSITDRKERGIYLREPFETSRAVEAVVKVNPVFHENADNADKVAFEMRFNLECDAPWVGHPEHTVLMHGGRTFRVQINPQSLIAGAHYTEILGHDTDNPERGPVFRVPITVVKPETIDTSWSKPWSRELNLTPGRIERRFQVVPHGATWAELTFRTGELEGERRLVMHVVQRVPGHSFSDKSARQYLTLRDNETQVRSFPVVGGRTLEVALAQYWSSLGKTRFEAELAFHGLVPDQGQLLIDGGSLVTRADVTAPFQKERIAPGGSLDTLRQSIRPSNFKARPLEGDRDRLPGNRQIHEAVLTYKFNVDKKTTLTPRLPVAQEDQFQESWESMIWMLFDKSKRYVSSGSDDQTVSVEKGDYVLRFHLRSDRHDHLKKLSDMPLMLDRKLAKSIELKVHTDPDDALLGGRAFGELTLAKGDRAAVYVATPRSLPGTAKAGDLLLGSIRYGKADGTLAGPGHKPGGFPVVLKVPPAKTSKDKKTDNGGKENEGKTAQEILTEEIRDLQVGRLAKWHAKKHKDDFDRLAAELLKSWPHHLPVLVEKLKRLDSDKTRKQHLEQVIAAADEVISRIDTEKLAKHYGVKLNPDDTEAKDLRAELDKQLNTLTDALYRKGRALAYWDDQLRGQDKQDESESSGLRKQLGDIDSSFEANFAELQKWADTAGDKFVLLQVRREKRLGRLGKALEHLNAKIKGAPHEKRLYEKRIRLLNELTWTEWRDYEKRWFIIRFPEKYQPF